MRQRLESVAKWLGAGAGRGLRSVCDQHLVPLRPGDRHGRCDEALGSQRRLSLDCSWRLFRVFGAGLREDCLDPAGGSGGRDVLDVQNRDTGGCD
jgi:hypothetical protein